MTRETLRYKIVLLKDEDISCYVAIVPSFDGCVTQGKTIFKAIERAKELMEIYINEGSSIPEPDFGEGAKKEEKIRVILNPSEVNYFWKNYLKRKVKNP